MLFEKLRQAAGQPRWAWLHSQTGWVGWGLKTARTASGNDRFARLREPWEGGQPRFVGLSFSPHEHRAAPWWEAFPAGMLAEPEALQGPLAVISAAAEDAPVPSLPQGAYESLEGTSRTAWDAAVQAALEAIAQGHLRKVVLARAEVLRLPTEIDAVEVLAALYRQHPRSYCFLMEPEPGAAFVGATPELLARVHGRTVETVALAGSAPRGANEHEDALLGRELLASPKDGWEHAVVVETIRGALAPLTVGLAVPPSPRLRRLPHIQHLETPIRGLLRPGVGLLDVAEALHPTPALGGDPKAEALDFIARHEPFPRGWYAAPVGMAFPDGSGELAVAIRSALLLGDVAVLYAGAGIVEGSDPAKEWEETGLKLATMRRALAEALAVQPQVG
ncbi:MAG: isochorismate synthase [Chloroflexi bacterium]|nr:isochorismate synthase [Chloroflexota bacterium]